MPHKQKRKPRSTKLRGVDTRRNIEDEEIKRLEQIIEEGKPEKGTNPLAEEHSITTSTSSQDGAKGSNSSQKAKNNNKKEEKKSYTSARLFADLPLSRPTQNGLKDANYTLMTDIQRAAIPHALCGRDVLGAAKTGSGKTLAFLIPLVEKLYRLKWNHNDGLGALVISPTRELALQIFECLRGIGIHHSLSAGLVIGGKDFEEEQSRISKMNILICTPGRLLQHMDQTRDFDCSNLQVLVLDEADRILDMGFSKTLNSIVANLPTERQTLLFSATQTKSVRDLARLSLVEPEYVSVHEQAKYSTPNKLQQYVTVMELHEKTDFLYSFIKKHLKSKCLVFFSSCKQVRFMYESFRHIRPGVSVMHMHGKMKQMKRMAVFLRFCESNHAVLFATDIAARGLDFPEVDWVLQMDCPEDVATYIHRVGRTARYESGGKALLALIPSEEPMIKQIQDRKIPLEVIKMNPKHSLSIQSKIAGFVSQDPDLKYLAQKALISYMRSVFLQSNKDIFSIEKIDTAKYAASLGLATVPLIKFAKKTDKNKSRSEATKSKKGKGKEKDESEDDNNVANSDEESEDDEVEKEQQSRLDKLFKRKNAGVLSESRLKLLNTEEEDEDDLMVLKRKNYDPDELPVVPIKEKNDFKKGVVVASGEAFKGSKERELYQEKIRQKVQEHDKVDKEIQREKRRVKRKMLKDQERAELGYHDNRKVGVQLALPEDDYYNDDDDEGEEDEEEEEYEEEDEDEDEQDEEESEEEEEEEDDDDEDDRRKKGKQADKRSRPEVKESSSKNKRPKFNTVDAELLAEKILQSRGVV